MTPAQWSRIEALFAQLEDVPAGQQADALLRHCPDDATVRDEVLSLLAASARPDAVLDQPARVGPVDPPAAPTASLAHGTQIGPWRLLDCIGRGGMGEVYAGERADGAFQRAVAIKVLKRGLDTDHLLSRFLRERRILSRLRHPNIAELIDAGATADGRPCLVMERVDGTPITDWCTANQAPVARILALVIEVCDAVHEAHQHLVVHRDLKPANVLVTADGQAKLLDFGIAKLLAHDDEGGELTHTRAAAPMTPAFAAPEQWLGDEVSTATDVYALGVLLYLLLTGVLPHRREGLLAVAAAGMTQTRTEKPSVAVRAQHPQRVKQLAGDLDLIVLKAMHADPARRYRTVAELRADLDRFLHLRPISARPDSLAYRAHRFVSRNRAGVAAAVISIAAVLAGLGVALYQARVARAEAQRAETESRKAGAVKDFLVGIFNKNSMGDPDGARAQATTARELLDSGAEKIRGGLLDAPEVRAELLGTIAGLYNDLRLPGPAVGLLEDRLRLLEREPGTSPLQRAEAQVALAGALAEAGRYADSDRLVAQALKVLDTPAHHDSLGRARALRIRARNAYQTQPATDPAAERDLLEALRIIEATAPRDAQRSLVLLELGDVVDYRGEGPRAGEYYGAAVEHARAIERPEDPTLLARAEQSYGEQLAALGRLDEGEALLRSSLERYREIAGPDAPVTLSARHALGSAMTAGHKLAEAEQELADALKDIERVRGAQDLSMSGVVRVDLAYVQQLRGRPEAAVQTAQRMIDLAEVNDPGSNNLGIAYGYQARALISMGQWAQATQRLAQAREVVIRLHGESSRAGDTFQALQASLDQARGNLDAAQALYADLLGDHVDIGAPMAWGDIAGSLGLAQIALERDRPAEAVPRLQGLLDRIEAAPDQATLVVAEAMTRNWLGESLRRAGQLDAAEPHLRRAVELRTELDDAASPWLAQARISLAQWWLDRGAPDEARALLAQAAEAHAQHPQLGEHLRRPLREAQARLAAMR